MFAWPFFALTRQQLKTENNKLNIYTQYLVKSTFETIWLFFHRPVGLVELLILYARVQFYTPRASDYRLISKTVYLQNLLYRQNEVQVIRPLLSMTSQLLSSRSLTISVWPLRQAYCIDVCSRRPPHRLMSTLCFIKISTLSL